MMAVLEVNKLSKTFKSFNAVSDLSFNLEEGRVLGFLGPNGAGKTTTIRMIVGLSKPTSGKINLSGEPVVFGKPTANKYLGYLSEQPSFYGWMTGNEYLQFIANIFDLSDKENRIKDVLSKVNLYEARNKRISAYSNGMKQRLGIAQALINDPKVLILDEPVSALDPIGRKEVMDIVAEIKKEKSILISTHILADVDRVCDDVAIINKGKLIIISPLAELKAKYAKPILEIDCSKSPDSIVNELKGQEWVERLDQEGNRLKVWLNDPSVVEKDIPLHFIANKGLGVLKYGLVLPETEDLFMELLKEEK